MHKNWIPALVRQAHHPDPFDFAQGHGEQSRIHERSRRTAGMTLWIFLPFILQAEEKTVAPKDPMAIAWNEANAAVSEIYYSDLIDKNPDEQTKNLWQAAFSVIYKGLDIMRKGTLPGQGIQGEGVDLPVLLPYFTETQGQLRNALDQIYIAKGMAASLEGRARRLLPILELIYQHFEDLRVAVLNKDYAAYDKTVISIAKLCALTNNTFKSKAPIPYGEVRKFPKKVVETQIKKGPIQILIFCLIVAVLVFFFLGSSALGARDFMESFVARWKLKTKELAYEYNRQFVGVGAGWLLYGPLIMSVLIGLVTMNLLIFLLACVIFVYFLPTELLKFVKERRRMKIESQLLDALILLADAMRSGLDLIQGLELAVHEMVPPISEEFDLLLKNYKLGMPFDEALKLFAQRVESDLVNYVVRAIIIQRQTGGNLTKIFDRIVDTIREEGRLKDKINALTAQPRLQSIVISVIPWFMLMVLYFFQPQAVGSFFTSTAGIITLLACVFWQTIGMMVIRKMAKIEV